MISQIGVGVQRRISPNGTFFKKSAPFFKMLSSKKAGLTEYVRPESALSGYGVSVEQPCLMGRLFSEEASGDPLEFQTMGLTPPYQLLVAG